jgi:hypothetical protein
MWSTPRKADPATPHYSEKSVRYLRRTKPYVRYQFTKTTTYCLFFFIAARRAAMNSAKRFCYRETDAIPELFTIL